MDTSMHRARRRGLIALLCATLILLPGASVSACVSLCQAQCDSAHDDNPSLTSCSSCGETGAPCADGADAPCSSDACRSCPQCAGGALVMHLPQLSAMPFQSTPVFNLPAPDAAWSDAFVPDIFQPPRA
ncbi:hypothetical protein HS125_07710 [bacterium]|nr:hypothetical protein [bacterium]